LAEAQRILKPDGTLVILLLNPLSNFFKKRHERPDSYVRNIKHRDLEKIVEDVSQFFTIIKKEYFLGIKDEELFNSRDPNVASLYCITAKSLS